MTDTKQIVRVAKAMYAVTKFFDRDGNRHGIKPTPWAERPAHFKKAYYRTARAAIKAMKEGKK